MEKQPFLFAVSGVKNSGKTTLITKLIPVLTEYGLKVATIKHDGHDFSADVPGTDTYAHLHAGAYGTAVFSDGKFMVVKQQEQEAEQKITEKQLMQMFPEADIILLEGFKGSSYPKVEIVRMGNSECCVCGGESTVAVVSDFIPEGCAPESVVDLNDVRAIADLILDEWFIRTKLSMVVLAGGKSSRMGCDKADLKYQNKTFLQWQIEKGKLMGISDILISGYRGSQSQELRGGRCQEQIGVEQHGNYVQEHIVADRYKDRGPLGGLEAAFRSAENEYCMVLTVDVPLIPVEELKRLIREFRKDSSTVSNNISRNTFGRAMLLKHGAQEEPLIGIYKADLAQEAEQELLTGKASVFAFLKRTGYEIYKSSGREEWFWNINDPAEYKELMLR